MTSATLHLATPTALERGLTAVARAITRYVDHRIGLRAERRQIAVDVLREQQARKQDPRALDIALLSIGSRSR